MLLFTIALSAVVYCLGLLGSLPDAFASPIWPATGFQIAMLFRFGTRALWAMTPGIVLIQLQLGLGGGLSVLASLMFATLSWSGMCSEALITRWLTRPTEDGQLDARSFVRFAAYAAPVGAASSALQGVTILILFNGYPDTVAWYIPYIVWWGGNLIGAYALVPLLTLTREQFLDLAKDWPATGAALVLLGLLLTGINFSPSIYLAQVCLVLLIVALYLLIRRQHYASFIAAISLGTLYFILLRISSYTVILVGEQISALLVLNLEIGLLLCGSIYVFRQVETNHRLTRQVQRDVLLLQSRVEERTRDLQVEVDERRRAEELAKRTSQLLTAVGSLRQDLIDEVDPFLGYRRLLERLLELTNSEYGFIGDLQSHLDTGKPFIKMYAISDLSWDKATLALYESLERDAFEFHNMDNLMGAVVLEQKPVVSNEPARDERAGGLPAGHPQLNSFVGIPVFYAREIVGEIGLANRPGGYDEEFLEWLEPVVVAIGQLIKARWDREAREQAEAELRQIAATDPLTGLSNRRHFEGELKRAIRSHERHKGDLSILMLDLDHFKRVNDEHGHEVGDAVLEDIANVLRSALRDIDHIGRWGGEEFLMLVSHSDSHAAVELAERLRLRIEQHLFPGAGHLTASIGVAQWLAGDSDESIIARADAAMYAAKAAGRNCVRVAEENGG